MCLSFEFSSCQVDRQVEISNLATPQINVSKAWFDVSIPVSQQVSTHIDRRLELSAGIQVFRVVNSKTRPPETHRSTLRTIANKANSPICRYAQAKLARSTHVDRRVDRTASGLFYFSRSKVFHVYSRLCVVQLIKPEVLFLRAASFYVAVRICVTAVRPTNCAGITRGFVSYG